MPSARDDDACRVPQLKVATIELLLGSAGGTWRARFNFKKSAWTEMYDVDEPPLIYLGVPITKPDMSVKSEKFKELKRRHGPKVLPKP